MTGLHPTVPGTIGNHWEPSDPTVPGTIGNHCSAPNGSRFPVPYRGTGPWEPFIERFPSGSRVTSTFGAPELARLVDEPHAIPRAERMEALREQRVTTARVAGDQDQAMPLSEQDRRLLEAVRATPGLSAYAYAERCDIRRATAPAILERLRLQGLVTISQGARGTSLWQPQEGA
jgi:hypothetical protein